MLPIYKLCFDEPEWQEEKEGDANENDEDGGSRFGDGRRDPFNAGGKGGDRSWGRRGWGGSSASVGSLSAKKCFFFFLTFEHSNQFEHFESIN